MSFLPSPFSHVTIRTGLGPTPIVDHLRNTGSVWPLLSLTLMKRKHFWVYSMQFLTKNSRMLVTLSKDTKAWRKYDKDGVMFNGCHHHILFPILASFPFLSLIPGQSAVIFTTTPHLNVQLACLKAPYMHKSTLPTFQLPNHNSYLTMIHQRVTANLDH